jgi:putative transposase
MSIRKIPFAPGEFYHLYNRGNSKQKIFHNAEDYARFMGLLYACNQEENFKIDNLSKGGSLYETEKCSKLINIGAYVLMPNHFHLLITSKEENNISKFMQKISTAYVMYYNKKYERTGGLFEGKFKSQYLGTDRYLKYIFSYIHLNPVKLIDSKWKDRGIRNKQKALEFLKKYTYSSYLDYLGINRLQYKILETKAFPKYFPDKRSFLKEIFDWLNYKDFR